MILEQGVIFLLLWAMFWGYWILRARSAQTGARLESSNSRLIHATLVIITLALLTIANIYPFNIRLLPKGNAIFLVGLAVTLLGLAFAIWARRHLGQYWSGAISFKQDHKLVETGPYKFVRNPIYAGILAGILGTAIAIGEIRGFLAVGTAFIAYYRKTRMEEIWLARHFGAEYEQYQKQVKALVPFIF